MSDLNLVPVVRPNGRTYRPRKGPRAVEVENADDHRGPCAWVYVLGTHDVDRAYRLAAAHWLDVDRDSAETTWSRLVMRGGDRVYEYDPARGAPAVIFNLGA